MSLLGFEPEVRYYRHNTYKRIRGMAGARAVLAGDALSVPVILLPGG